MSFEWQGFWRTLQDSTFALWFGWSVIIAIIIFPVTSMFVSCGEQSAREDIEVAKLEAQHGNRDADRLETMKWMVSRGVHPLVARCALAKHDSQTCNSLINDLEDEERTTIKEMLADPFVEVVEGTPAETGLVALPKDPQDYIEGLDFGLRSPTK